MAETNIPNNPNLPPVTPFTTKGNVASLANKDTLSNLKESQPPKTFGDQIKKVGAAGAGVAVIKAATQSTIAKLYKEKASLVQEGIKLDIDHQKTLQTIEVKHTPKKQIQNGQTIETPAEYNDTEYQLAIDNENKNYDNAKANLQERKEKNQKAIDDYLKDPFKKQKDAKKKRQEARKKKEKRNKEEKTKANKAKKQAVLKNAKKSLVPILALTLTNKIAQVIAQNDKIAKLVNDTNAIITDANESGDTTKLSNAKLARDNAIKVIQSNEDKIKKIRDDIKRISTYISIFGIIVTIISAIPIPTAVPPGIGIPTNLIIKFVKILDKANRIVLSLSALIPALLSALDKAINILEDYKTQLFDINGKLENAAVSGANGISSLLNNGAGGSTRGTGAGAGAGAGAGIGDDGGIKLGVVDEVYKGFTFVIKEEENNPKYTVRGFKRHYAIALNDKNVEILKSEYSFTLDPDDLISQLKLLIDQQNLSTGDGQSYNKSEQQNDPSAQQKALLNTSKNSAPNSPLKQALDREKQQQSEGDMGIGNTLPSSTSIKKALEAVSKKPPQPEIVKGPTKSLSAEVPLSIEKKAFYAGIIIAPTPPTPPNFKIDAAYILKKNIEWKANYKKYLKNAGSDITNLPS